LRGRRRCNCGLCRRHARVNVGQEAQRLEGLLQVLQVGHPRCIQISLLHATAQGASGQQVLHVLRRELLSELANTRLLDTQLTELTAQGPKLSAERPDPLAQRTLLLTHLHQLVHVLLSELAKLQTHLPLCLRARQAKLAKLLPDLAQRLASGLLLRRSVHAKLAASLRELTGRLRPREARLRSGLLRANVLLRTRQSKLTRLRSALQTKLALLRQLFSGKTKLSSLPCRL
jgi:hypothetical protein